MKITKVFFKVVAYVLMMVIAIDVFYPGLENTPGDGFIKRNSPVLENIQGRKTSYYVFFEGIGWSEFPVRNSYEVPAWFQKMTECKPKLYSAEDMYHSNDEWYNTFFYLRLLFHIIIMPGLIILCFKFSGSFDIEE